MSLSLSVQAQDSLQTARIGVLARAYGDSIVLRWAPSTPVAWQQLNQVGYRVERHTIVRNGQVLEEPERRLLTDEPVRPRLLADWRTLADQDRYAAIAAQALYGESFRVDAPSGSDLVQMINQAREQEQRFSFALFSADMSAITAQYSGLRLTDREIQPNEKYLYKVFSAQPLAVSLDTGLVFLSGSDLTELTAPVEVSATFTDQQVMLRWNIYYHRSVYVAYRVERSRDGTSFAPIIELPISFVHDDNHYGYKSDSLPGNDRVYHYRVRGITSFGELGPPSEVVSGQGYQALHSPPTITQAELAVAGGATITWEINQEESSCVHHFSVAKASAVAGPYQPVAPSLPANVRAFTDPQAEGTRYYRVTAHGQRDEAKSSFPVLVQAEDSIPPSVPQRVQGVVDTTGRVSLHWPPSPESDVRGYRVFRSNYPDRDFIQTTREPVTDTTFADQVGLKNSTATVYYKVSAVDHRLNPSDLSKAVALRKPDIVPPVAPVFRAARARPDGVQLSWMGSPSEDLAHYLIYRRTPGETSWQLVSTALDTARGFLDATVVSSQAYDYVILAVDSSRLESSPTAPLSVMSWAAARPKIVHTYTEADTDRKRILIRWDYPYQEVKEYRIYRAEADTPLRWYDTATTPPLQFSDEAVTPSQTYHYRIKAVYEDGSQSPLSEAFTVEF